MARAAGTSSRTQRLIALGATALLALTTAMALGRVFIGAEASYRLMAAGLASALLACALERKNLLLASLTSVAGLLVAVGVFVFPATTWHGVPTLETLHALADAASIVGQEARVQVAPSPPLAPLMLAALTATWAAVFSAHALAFRAGSPLVALMPPIALVAFADTVLDQFVKPIYGVFFLGAALAVIFADGLRRLQGWGAVWTGPGRQARLSVTAGRGARRVAFAAVGVALIAPILVPGFGSKALIDLSTSSDGGIHIDPLVSVANQLQRNDPQPAFTVETTQPTYYRFITLPDFDGAGWHPDPNPTTVDLPQDLTATEPYLDPTVVSGVDSISQSFQLLSDLDQNWLPVAAPPTSVHLDRPASWDAQNGTVSFDGPLDAGTEYTTASLLLRPTPAQLQDVRALPTPAMIPRYTDLPSGLDPEIHRIALSWTEGATTPYQQVLDIQNHLTDGSFLYRTDVPARDDANALLDFLTVNRVGMCQQFATAMAVLLRELGIPTRVAVGFTSGTQSSTDPNQWTVSSTDAHAWPEVLFPGYGWLPFEPTPSRVNPVASVYTNPVQSPQCNRPGGCPGRPGGANGAGGPGTGRQQGQLHGKNPFLLEGGRDTGSLATLPTAAPASAPSRVPGGRRILLLALGVLLLVILLLPLGRAALRRRRLRRAAGVPRQLILAVYDVFTERASELGFARGLGETLEEYRERVADSGLLSDGHLDRLTRITAAAAYAPQEPASGDAREAAEDAATALRDLRRGTPWPARIRGLYLRER